MSNFDSPPGDVLDRALADHHRKLVGDIAATLDLKVGLPEALIPARHADLIATFACSLDLDAGLAAIVREGSLRIVAEEPTSKLARLVPHPGYIIGDPDALVDMDWSGHWDVDPL